MTATARAATALVLAWALVAAPAGAAIPKGPIPTRPAAPGVTPDAIVARARALGQAGDCKGALGLLDPLIAVPALQGSRTRTAAQVVRLVCLDKVGRHADVPAVLAELKAQAPNAPIVLSYEIFADVDGGRYAEAADQLSGMAGEHPETLVMLSGRLWRVLSQALTLQHDYARRDGLALALAQAGWKPSDDPDISESLAFDGIGTLIERQDTDGAQDLLNHIEEPEMFLQMATERRYAPIWPAVEAKLGPQGGTAADDFARDALAAYAAAPKDEHAVRDAVRAYMMLGRYDDATTTAAPVTVKAGMSEVAVSTIVAAARGLAAKGDRAGQIARLQPFTMLDLGTTPNAMSALITLAEVFHEAGRYDDELALSQKMLTAQSKSLSAYGAAWLKRNEVCALSGLHRPEEAKPVADALLTAATDNEAAAIEGLLCAGREGDAATIAVKTLATDEGASRLADQFQPAGAFYASETSRLRALWTHLLARPDVKTAFDKSVRILPKPLWPATAPRSIPLLPGSSTTT